MQRGGPVPLQKWHGIQARIGDILPKKLINHFSFLSQGYDLTSSLRNASRETFASESARCAAARRAIGTRYGLQET